MSIDGAAPANMIISEDKGRYYAQVTFDLLSFAYLIGPNRSRRKISMLVGGQDVPVPARHICTLNQVLLAARTFAESGELNDSLDWDD